jgi:hypothetical protein
MIFAGIALMPAVHPTVLAAGTVTYGPASATTVIYGEAGKYATQSPASSMRTMALLIALMRGGLNVKLSTVWTRGLPVFALAFVPYVIEMAVEAAAAPWLLPGYYTTHAKGAAPTDLVAWASASVWAPLSPSIVIPNTLLMVEAGYRHAPQVVLTGAPLEVSVALVVEGVMAGVQTALNSGGSPQDTLAHIPVYVIGSALYGLAFSLAFYAYTLLRARPELARAGLPKADPAERLFVFVSIFVMSYVTSIDDVDVPWLIGFFSCLSMAMGTQYLLPTVADELAVQLKVPWFYAECMLFVLTGCVIRPAIDLGLANDLFGWFFAVMLLGQLGRMLGDVVVALLWQLQVNRARGRGSPLLWTRADWADVARRAALVWVCTIPKATLQGTLGPKLTTVFKAGGFTSASTFVAPSAAISILYSATFGNLLVYSVGYALTKVLDAQEVADHELAAAAAAKEAEAAAAAAAAGSGASSAEAAARDAAAGEESEAALSVRAAEEVS